MYFRNFQTNVWGISFEALESSIHPGTRTMVAIVIIDNLSMPVESVSGSVASSSLSSCLARMLSGVVEGRISCLLLSLLF